MILINTLSDQELCNLIKEKNSNEAMKELISRHTGVYILNINKFKHSSYLSYQDLHDNKSYVIYQAALGFEESRGKFTTYLSQLVWRHCLNQIKIQKKISENEEPREDLTTLNIPPSGLSLIDQIQYSDIFNEMEVSLGSLDEDRQEIFKQRYLTGDANPVAWKEVGESLGFSKQNCQQQNKLTIQRIESKIGKELI